MIHKWFITIDYFFGKLIYVDRPFKQKNLVDGNHHLILNVQLHILLKALTTLFVWVVGVEEGVVELVIYTRSELVRLKMFVEMVIDRRCEMETVIDRRG